MHGRCWAENFKPLRTQHTQANRWSVSGQVTDTYSQNTHITLTLPVKQWGGFRDFWVVLGVGCKVVFNWRKECVYNKWFISWDFKTPTHAYTHTLQLFTLSLGAAMTWWLKNWARQKVAGSLLKSSDHGVLTTATMCL